MQMLQAQLFLDISALWQHFSQEYQQLQVKGTGELCLMQTI
jgi:hypothetical protein